MAEYTNVSKIHENLLELLHPFLYEAQISNFTRNMDVDYEAELS